MIEVDKPVEPVRVSVNMGFKKNTGNYENLDINVGISASARESETVDAAFERVYAFVEQKLVAKFEETLAALREAGLEQ